MSIPRAPHPAKPALATDQYQRLIEGIEEYAIFMLDRDGVICSWNRGAQIMKGYSAQEIIGKHFSVFYPAEQIAQGFPARELKTAEEVGKYEDEGWRLRKDGSRFWANVVITRILDSGGRLVGFSKISRDLTERREQELRLRHSEERFRLLVTCVKDYAIFMLDTQGYVATWNTGAEFIKGYTASEVIGSHFSRFYPAEAIKRGLPEEELQGAMMQGRFEDEGWRVRKDGSRFWANVIITAVRNADGHLIGFSKITRNLNERREHEEALRQSEERFRLLVDGVTEYAIMMLDESGVVVSWNAGAERIKGYKSHEIVGKHVSHFYPAEAIQANEPWERLQEARRDGRAASEGWRVRKDGTLFWAGVVTTALYDEDGRLYGFAKVTQDLTERRHAEALADTTQRMHEFIAMLAHELRNPLAPIRNAVALMGRKGLNDPALEAMRKTIERQSLQLARLLDELLDVNRIARGDLTINREPVDVPEVIARAVETTRPLIEKRGHTLELKIPEAAMRVTGDSVRLTQALVNLLHNAAKYTPDGGRISLTALVRGAELDIRVLDNGKGIERDMLEKVFELFVQIDPLANDTMGGLGVGLALVRRIIELHGGNVLARSEGPGRGAEFIVRLPLASAEVEPIAAEVAGGAGELPQLRVLVVDDNHDAANTLALLLEAMGQQVTAVYDGPTAVSMAQKFRPDVIVTDIGMPGMSGYAVARAIRAALPDNPPVLAAVTGWGQETDKTRAEEAGFRYHFVKPISDEMLRELLTAVASGQAGARAMLSPGPS
jgi:PAS domain S-box-containing protein